jgi:hypothetical protein
MITTLSGFKRCITISFRWRGYRSRKLFDFYRLKQQLRELETLNEQTRQIIEIKRTEIIKARRLAIQEELQKRTDKESGRSHHLLSTKSIPGVLKFKNSEYEMTETHLLNSSSLKMCISKIGTNEKNIVVKPVRNYIGKEDKEKLFQGPFLVLRIDIAKVQIVPEIANSPEAYPTS